MLVKPLSGPSIMYINVPKMMHKMITLNKKTAILSLLFFKAVSNWFEAPTKCTSFKILKTRSNRTVLINTKKCSPGKIKSM